MRILIVGAAGWGNVGDDLITLALKKWVEADGAEVLLAGGPHAFNGTRVAIPLLGSTQSKLRLIWVILRAHYVIIGGGGLLDDRVPRFYRPFTRVAWICRLLARKYSFVGIGVGPIRSSDSASSYRRAANGAMHVLVRDDDSRGRLLAAGVRRRIDVVDDPVVWLQDGVPLLGDRAPATPPAYDLCVNLRNWKVFAGDEFTTLGTHEILRVVAEAINESYAPEQKVALLSFSSLMGDDDSKVLEMLRPLLRSRVETFYATSTDEVTNVIRLSKRMLSMRLHGCLIAASENVPVVGLAYDPKLAQQGARIGFASLRLTSDLTAQGICAGLREAQILPNAQSRPPIAIWKSEV